MKTIYLHGFLKDQFGESFRMDVQTPREAVMALSAQLPGFEKTIRAGRWHILRGALANEDDVSEDSVDVALGNQDEVHIMPAIEGAGSNMGVFTIIVGLVLFVAGFFTGGSTWGPMMMMMGAGMAVGGIVQMTMKVPGADTTAGESKDNKASYLFNGGTNQSTQGVAVPRGYGRVMVGSIVVSAGLYAEEMTQ